MTIAHLSDLHLGKSPNQRAACLALRDAISECHADHVIVTGDITEHGSASELALFKEIFSGLLASGKMTIMPGNHDRLGDESAKDMMDGRVGLTTGQGFRVIAIDSTGPHNRRSFASHGKVDDAIIAQVMDLIDQTPPDDFVIVALHHHLLPLPEDLWLETFSKWLHLPCAAELRLGRKLLEKLQDHCDLVLHGHRHAPSEKIFLTDKNVQARCDGRDLFLYNAGSSTALGRFRIFNIQNGKLQGPPMWVEANI